MKTVIALLLLLVPVLASAAPQVVASGGDKETTIVRDNDKERKSFPRSNRMHIRISTARPEIVTPPPKKNPQ